MGISIDSNYNYNLYITNKIVVKYSDEYMANYISKVQT